MFSNNTLSAEQTWPLLALMCGWVAFSIWLEQKYKWASKLSGAILALIGALLMVNLNIIPVSAPSLMTLCGVLLCRLQSPCCL